MIPRRVWAKGYATYADVSWDIPEGVTAILGQNEGGEGISSNGAGKTRLLELIPLALWGPASSWSDYVSAGSDATCEIGLEFDHAGDVYRVRRTFSPKGRGKTTLDFERSVTDRYTADDEGEPDEIYVTNWHPLTRESQAATQQAIRDLLGIGEATFHHSVFAAQGARHFADSTLTPRERMEVLSDGLGLDSWEAFREACAADRRAVEAEHDGLRAKMGEWADVVAQRDEIERAEAEASEAGKRAVAGAAQARGNLTHHEGLLRAAKESRAGYDAAYREVAACQAALHAIERERAAKRQQAWNRKAELERERDRRASKAKACDREALAFKTRADERFAEARRLADNGNGTCDRCEQPIRGAALDAAVASIEAEFQTLHEEAQRLLHEGGKERRAAAQYQDELDALTDPTDDAETAAKQTAAELALHDATGRMSAMKATATDDATIGAMERNVATARDEVAYAERQLAAAHSAHGEAKERLRQLNETAASFANAEAKQRILAQDLDVLRELEKAYGRSGIPVLLLESLYVPRIEAEANRVLDAWGVPFSVELRTQRELKSADRLRDTLDVVVHSPGGVRSFRTYSGGERDRVSTALRIALARVISASRGHSLGVFALDELAHLDAAGTEKLAELLRELSREIACVLFISHDTDLSDAFDQRVLVVRENGRSRLEEAA